LKTDVSEESVAVIFCVEEQDKQETKLKKASSRATLLANLFMLTSLAGPFDNPEDEGDIFFRSIG
jgi:hypothetical protein